MKTKLDTIKLNRLLKSHGKKKQWIAESLGWSRQLLYYHITNKTLYSADKIAPLFGLKGKDLMK